MFEKVLTIAAAVQNSFPNLPLSKWINFLVSDKNLFNFISKNRLLGDVATELKLIPPPPLSSACWRFCLGQILLSPLKQQRALECWVQSRIGSRNKGNILSRNLIQVSIMNCWNFRKPLFDTVAISSLDSIAILYLPFRSNYEVRFTRASLFVSYHQVDLSNPVIWINSEVFDFLCINWCLNYYFPNHGQFAINNLFDTRLEQAGYGR